MKTPQCRKRSPRDITSIMGLGLLGAVLAITAPCARAFSLIGPYASWMDEAKSFRQPGRDIGGPMNFGEGHRWNVPVVTYGFDASFLEYFGSNGVAEVERAIAHYTRATPEQAAVAYKAFFPVWQDKVPRVDSRGVANAIRFSASPQVRRLTPASLIDDSLLQELVRSGYVKSLYPD